MGYRIAVSVLDFLCLLSKQVKREKKENNLYYKEKPSKDYDNKGIDFN